jgi:hypothetical protein
VVMLWVGGASLWGDCGDGEGETCGDWVAGACGGSLTSLYIKEIIDCFFNELKPFICNS